MFDARHGEGTDASADVGTRRDRATPADAHGRPTAATSAAVATTAAGHSAAGSMEGLRRDFGGDMAVLMVRTIPDAAAGETARRRDVVSRPPEVPGPARAAMPRR